jgi:hypothetical protein
MWIFIVVGGLVFGLFAFSQIIYPLFYALPRAKRLANEGKLVKPIPLFTIVIPPIIWIILITGSILLVNKHFAIYAKLYYIALCVILIVVIAQIPKQNRDLEIDFDDTWKEYLKGD